MVVKQLCQMKRLEMRNGNWLMPGVAQPKVKLFKVLTQRLRVSAIRKKLLSSTQKTSDVELRSLLQDDHKQRHIQNWKRV